MHVHAGGEDWTIGPHFETGTVVTIRSATSGKFLSLGEGKTFLLCTEEMVPKDHSSEWTLVRYPGTNYYEISHPWTLKTLDVFEESVKNGEKVVAWEPNGKNNQKWEFGKGKKGFFIRCVKSGKALDMIDGRPDKVGQWDFWGGPNQIWHVFPFQE